MKSPQYRIWLPVALLAAWSAPAKATVKIASFTPSVASPQPIGTTISWTAVGVDSNPGPLTFQFSLTPPNGSPLMIKDFNVGTATRGSWVSQPYDWAPTDIEGTYQVQVVAKDFASGESVSSTVSFTLTSPLTGDSPVVQRTQNPLVALFTAPSCPAGSSMRVFFEAQSKSVPATTTNWMDCRPPATMTFEVAGMYPETAYRLYSQTNSGGHVANGPTANFTTGGLSASIPFPTFTNSIPASPSDPNRMILYSFFDVAQPDSPPNVATDLAGNIVWYNYASGSTHSQMMMRPLQNNFLGAEFGTAWIPGVTQYQVMRQIDWAGNILRETNTGVLEQELLALGAVDAQPCNTLPSPPPVGAACLGLFHHDAILTLPNGHMALLVDIEKIFPPGTQGDTSGLPVDILGDMIVVLDENWQAVWYWDAFDPAGGGNGYPQLPVSRPAVLNETCATGQPSCLIVFLGGPGISPVAHDWLHANCLYYWPHDGAGGTSTLPGDIIWSSRHQDWVMKIDYKDGAGTGDILWRMGPSGDFAFNNKYNDPWPWFSHQHDVGIEDNGLGVLSTMDNGNTRISPPTGPGSSTGGVPGLGSNCGPNDCNNRGMALNFDETTMQVTPVLSVNLGVYSEAMGSAQLLADGNYFFLSAIVATSSTAFSYAIEIQPTPGTASGIQVLNTQGPVSYRAWQIPDLYSPPIT